MKYNSKALYSALAVACLFPVAASSSGTGPGEAIEPDEELIAGLTEVRSWIEVGIGHVGDGSFRHGEYSGLEDDGLYPIVSFDIHERGSWNSDSTRYRRFQGSDLGLDSRSLAAEYGDQGRYRLWLEYDQIPRYYSDSARTVFAGAGGTSLTLPPGGGYGDIPAYLRDVNLEQERQRFRLGLEQHFASRWQGRVNFSHETKDGTRTLGAMAGGSAVVLPEPVDYTTKNIAATLAYTGEQAQAEIGYHISLFENHKPVFAWQDPYATDWAGAATREATSAPDNEFHQIRLAGGYNLNLVTRLHANAAVGRMVQDETFVDAGIALPRSNLGGEIDTAVVNLGLATRLTPRLNITASYRHDDRDNRTPAIDVTAFNRTSRPYSFTEDRYRLAAAWRLAPRTSLSLGYDRRELDRTLVAREDSTENTWEARLRTAVSDLMPDELRQSWLADRDRDRYGLFASYNPVDPLTLGVKANRVHDRYRGSELGLTGGEASNYSLDASYFTAAGFTTYAFYNVEEVALRLAGDGWRAQQDDDTVSAGIGARKSFMADRLDLSADLVYARGKGRTDVDADRLDTGTRLRQFRLAGDYRISDDLTVRLGYRYERYDASDRALDGVAADAVPGLIGISDESPDYDVHVIAASVRYRF